MSIPVYIRKDYFRAVTLSDKSAHILEFQYRPETVEVFEEGLSVFFMRYYLESRSKAEIVEFYLTDFTIRGKGYGSACMGEIVSEMQKKGVTLITAPTGYQLAPLGYTGPEQYSELMKEFYYKNGFEISGDGDLALKILN